MCDVIGSYRCMNTTHSNDKKHTGVRRVAGRRAATARSVLVCDLSGTHTDLANSLEPAGWKVDHADSVAVTEKLLCRVTRLI